VTTYARKGGVGGRLFFLNRYNKRHKRGRDTHNAGRGRLELAAAATAVSLSLLRSCSMFPHCHFVMGHAPSPTGCCSCPNNRHTYRHYVVSCNPNRYV